MRTPSRRSVLMTSLAAAGLMVPRGGRAAGVAERKFLFVFCPGGWDVCDAFAPIFNSTTDHQPGDEAADVGGFRITDGAARPSVRAFFEAWGSRTCLINGMQVPSVAHDVCTRLTMTGWANEGHDDWASIVAGETTMDRPLPNVHISGPIFPMHYGQASVRVGVNGQLSRLLDGTALLRSDNVVPPVTSGRAALETAFVTSRVDRWARSVAAGQPARLAAAETLALQRAARLGPVSDDLMAIKPNLYNTLSIAVGAMAAGLSRSGMIAYGTGANGAWDSHSGNDYQQVLYEELFDALGKVMEDLASTPGEVEPSLLDETTVVVLSEMGRTPQLNSAGGKDHWTWTSALFAGGAAAGGRTIGGWTEGLTGEPVDLASGDVFAGGTTIQPAHLGATILAMAGLDPAEFIDPDIGAPIEGAIG